MKKTSTPPVVAPRKSKRGKIRYDDLPPSCVPVIMAGHRKSRGRK